LCNYSINDVIILLDELCVKKELRKNEKEELFSKKYDEGLERFKRNYYQFIEKLNDLKHLVNQDNCILNMIINETPEIMKEFTRKISEKKDITDCIYGNTSELIDLLNDISTNSC
jgi:hypothetical protein